MKSPNPPRVEDHYLYWDICPMEGSARCSHWIYRIENGWRPNRRIRAMGYDEASQYYGVYIWEYLNIISPLLDKQRETT